jgi:hypothetical protein
MKRLLTMEKLAVKRMRTQFKARRHNDYTSFLKGFEAAR